MITRLVLHPLRSDAVVDPAVVRQALQSIDCISEPLDTDGRFSAGPRFMELVVFLGCSPNIKTEPADGTDDEFCHVFIGTPLARTRFRSATDLRAPRCPHCRRELGDWRSLLTQWTEGAGQGAWECAGCGQTTAVRELDWRRLAGFGRFFIEVRGIHPHEAVPSDELLATLSATTNGGWQFFYEF